MTKKLFIALPCHETVDPHFFASMLNLKISAEISSNLVISPLFGDSAIGRARNTLTARFLKSDCTDLLFIDSDLVFDMNHINRILSHKEDVVGGVYFKKSEGGPQIVCNGMDTETPCRADAMQEVKYVGTGFLKVSRHAFEVLIAEYGDELWYTSDSSKEKEYDFWKMGVFTFPDNTRRWLSEDWAFCEMWRRSGGQVWMDTRCILGHSGNVVYPLKEQKAACIKHDPLPLQESIA